MTGHDLDCREGPGDIRLAFAREGGDLCIRVTNPAGAGTSPNPGAGLGLANTRDRLRLMHPQASLQAGLQGARFVAEVRLPLGPGDQGTGLPARQSNAETRGPYPPWRPA